MGVEQYIRYILRSEAWPCLFSNPGVCITTMRGAHGVAPTGPRVDQKILIIYYFIDRVLSMPPRPAFSVARRETHVIVGTGHAGSEAAFALRERGFKGRIVLLGEECHAPYMRPPLSKKFMSGDVDQDRITFRPVAAYASHDIELKLGVPVDGLDPTAGCVQLGNGLRLGYDQLLIATGSRARLLDVPGARGPGIHYLRRIDDAVRLREALRPGCRVTVVGGGYLGLEIAAVAAQCGARVRVIEIDARLLNRVTAPEVSAFFEATHRAHRVDIRCGTHVVAFEGTDRLEAVVTSGGRFETDVAVIGIGAEPNVELALQAGLRCDDGIEVDASCRTSDPRIFAAGDCTKHPNRFAARRVRLESVQNAVDQAMVAASNMCGGDVTYDRVPWFWSQQYEFSLQTAGMLHGHDQRVERGNLASGRFAMLYYRAGTLIAIDAVNMPREYLAARQAIGQAVPSVARPESWSDQAA